MPIPSANTLKELADTFRSCAEKWKSTNVLARSQFDFISNFSGDRRDGICHGLSMTWLEFERKEGTNNTFQSFLNLTGEGELVKRTPSSPANPSTWQRNNFAVNLITSAQLMQESDGVESIALFRTEGTRTNLKMSSLGFSVVANEDYGGGRSHGHKDLGTFVGRGDYFYLLHVRAHTMAASSIGGVQKFYDPNVGEAQFNSIDNLGKFFSEYFKTRIPMQSYAEKGALKVHVGVTRYQGQIVRRK
jgi:hypothetical protein